MTSHLHSLAVDLINEAKGTPDAKSKMYLLEQVKEIILHRDASLLPEMFPNVTDFMIERSNPLRRMLITFASEALTKNDAITAPALNLYAFLSSDMDASIVSKIATELKPHYPQVAMYIVNLPLKSKTSKLDPKELWQNLRSISAKFVEILSAEKPEGVKLSSLKMLEVQILFGLAPSADTGKVVDPRLRGRSRAADSGQTKSSADIPLHHPFINRDDVEQEAESLFSKLLLWASKGGPQGVPFTPNQMAVLGQVIANVASMRPKNTSKAMTALLVMLQGKGNISENMSGSNREYLARSVHRLVRIVSGKSDSEDSLGKLRAALQHLESLGFTDTSTEAGKKRSAGEMDEDEDTSGDSSRRASAIAAIDAAELSRGKRQAVELEGKERAAAVPTGGAVGAGAPGSISTASATTDLCAEIADVSEGAPTVKLATVQSDAGSKAGALKVQAVALTGAESYQYGQVGNAAVLRLLYAIPSMYLMQDPKKAVATATKLAIRCIMCSAIAAMQDTTSKPEDLEDGKFNSMVEATILLNIAPNVSSKYTDDVPKKTPIPKAVWTALGFVLHISMEEYGVMAQQQGAVGDKLPFNQRLEILYAMLEEIQRRKAHQEKLVSRVDPVDDFVELSYQSIAHFETMHESILMVVLSRMLQIAILRPHVPSFLRRVSEITPIPLKCARLLQLLMYSGSRSADGRRGSQRFEAMSLLAQLAATGDQYSVHIEDKSQKLAPNDDLANSALNMLLWCATCDDFEARSKVITILIQEIVTNEYPAQDAVIAFSVHSAVSVVGYDACGQRTKAVAELLALQDAEHESKSKNEKGNGEGRETHSIESEDEGKSSTQTEKPSEGEPNTAMDVVGQEGADEAEEIDTEDPEAEGNDVDDGTLGTSLLSMIDSYDNGTLFDGTFTSPPILMDQLEPHAKRAFQLFSQISVSRPSLLCTFVDLYGVIAAQKLAAEQETGTDPKSSGDDKKGAESSKQSSSSETKKDKKDIPKSKWDIMMAYLTAEMRNIVPAMVARQDVERLFGYMKKVDPLSMPLFETVLSLLLNDFQMPASAKMIAAVLEFIEMNPRHIAPDSSVVAWTGTADYMIEGVDCRNPGAVRLLVPLLGGFNTENAEKIVPFLVRSLADDGDNEALKTAFKRLIKARPPPLTKSALLVALHRVDYEAYGFTQKSNSDKQKLLLNSIRLCLNDAEEFRSDVLKDALGKLVRDEAPSWALMRTVILAYVAHSDMKRFTLSEIIPCLVRKQAWSTAPKLWDGVMYAMKTLAGHKDAEPSIRCMLGLPAPQMKGVFKAAPQAKAVMGKVLKALSESEKEEVLSGRWAGIETAVDDAKSKIIKELS